jgi:hypothetical protein
VRILWGALDRALSADLAELSLRYCKTGELTMFPDATHWLHHEEQESVSRALAEFFCLIRRVHAALWLTPWPPRARRIAGNYDVKADEKVLS